MTLAFEGGANLTFVQDADDDATFAALVQ